MPRKFTNWGKAQQMKRSLKVLGVAATAMFLAASALPAQAHGWGGRSPAIVFQFGAPAYSPPVVYVAPVTCATDQIIATGQEIVQRYTVYNQPWYRILMNYQIHQNSCNGSRWKTYSYP